MSDQEGLQPGRYRFREYEDTPSSVEQMRSAPSAGPIQPVQFPPRYGNPQSQPASMPYPPSLHYPSPGYGYPAAYYPAPPVQVVPRQKKMLYFPLTRTISAGKQAVSMTIYSVLMTALLTGSIFSIILTSANQQPNNIFVHPNGTANGLLILVFSSFVLLIIPAMTLLCGALFGATRAFLVTCIVEGVTASIGFLYMFAQHIPMNISFNSPVLIVFILAPITAALVGLCYDRRRYAAWWKSFLSMLAGSALFVIVLLTLTAILGRPTGTSSSDTLAGFYIAIGCSGLLLIPLMALPIAGVEGILHAVLANRREKK